MKRDVPLEHSGWTEPLPPLGDNAGECPKCQGDTTVWKTGTNRAELLIRYRVCNECGYKYKTVELLAFGNFVSLRNKEKKQ